MSCSPIFLDGSLSVLGEGLVGVELRVDEHFTLVVGRPVPVVSNAAGCLTSFRNDEAQSLFKPLHVIGLRPH
jgi:hypothetical protein